jgi:hypothetical protein
MLTVTIGNKITKWHFLPFFLIWVIVFSIFAFVICHFILFILISLFFIVNKNINLIPNYPLWWNLVAGFFIWCISQIITVNDDLKIENNASLEDWKKPKNTFTKKTITSHFPVWIKNIWHYIDIVRFFISWKHYNDALNGWNSICEKPEYEAQKSHDAIVVIIYSFIRPDPVFVGVDLLINHMFNNVHYKVYCCENSKDFFDVVNNPNVKNLWIFGHGSRELLRCSDKKCEYEKLVRILIPEALNKDYVYQFTCNNSDEKSLADYLSNGNGFANYKINNVYEIKKWIENIVMDDSWKTH